MPVRLIAGPADHEPGSGTLLLPGQAQAREYGVITDQSDGAHESPWVVVPQPVQVYVLSGCGVWRVVMWPHMVVWQGSQRAPEGTRVKPPGVR